MPKRFNPFSVKVDNKKKRFVMPKKFSRFLKSLPDPVIEDEISEEDCEDEESSFFIQRTDTPPRSDQRHSKTRQSNFKMSPGDSSSNNLSSPKVLFDLYNGAEKAIASFREAKKQNSPMLGDSSTNVSITDLSSDLSVSTVSKLKQQ